MNINGYRLKAELQNANSGFSKWGFAVKGRKEYFIKELITPVYPMDPEVMGPALFESKRSFCRDYENRYRKLYELINGAGFGSLVRIIEFFRHGSRYYIITEKVEGKSVPMERIAAQSWEDKNLLLKSVAYGFFCLHNAGIVHFDVKPANILVKKTKQGKYTGKIIDFDSGFFKEEKRDVELGGDLTYLAPETFLAIRGEDVKLTEKADIFALGLVFHQYCTGQLPSFNTIEYEYPFEAVLDGGGVTTNAAVLPPDLNELITKMLSVDPAMRPTAKEIVEQLNKGGPVAVETVTTPGSRLIMSKTLRKTVTETVEPSAENKMETSAGETSDNAWFQKAGDL